MYKVGFSDENCDHDTNFEERLTIEKHLEQQPSMGECEDPMLDIKNYSKFCNFGKMEIEYCATKCDIEKGCKKCFNYNVKNSNWNIDDVDEDY